MLEHLKLAYWIPFLWVGLLLAAILAYPIFRLLIKLNSRQKVSEYAPKTHQTKAGTPTMGGLLFVIPFLLVSIPCFFTSGCMMAGPLVLIFALIGFVDDFVIPRKWPGKRGLGWKQKLLMELVAVVVYLVFIQGVSDTVDFVVTGFCILFFANAYNFADGLDGLASAIYLLTVPGLIALNVVVDRPEAIAPLLAMAGVMLPFSFLNAPKAKVFMGDVGSLAVGALIGVVYALPWHQQVSERHSSLAAVMTVPFAIGWIVLAFVYIAELVPVPLQIFWVKVFKKRLFPFTPIHHAFEKEGWPETRVVWMFALVQAVCTAGCLTLCLSFGWKWPWQ